MGTPALKEYQFSNEICSYGCNKQAKFAFKNGKFCCNNTPHNCSSVKLRNSNSLKLSYQTGRLKNKKVSEATKAKISASTKITMNRLSDLRSWDSLKISGKKIRVRKEQNYKCKRCDLDEWFNEKLIIEIDHIDGDTDNNIRENLVGLCPNCHSLTPTWRGRNKRLVDGTVDK